LSENPVAFQRVMLNFILKKSVPPAQYPSINTANNSYK